MIIGDKIYLRKITQEDTENILKWRNSSSVKKTFLYKEI